MRWRTIPSLIKTSWDNRAVLSVQEARSRHYSLSGAYLDICNVDESVALTAEHVAFRQLHPHISNN